MADDGQQGSSKPPDSQPRKLTGWAAGGKSGKRRTKLVFGPKEWLALLDAFREHGANFSAVSQATGTLLTTCRRAYLKGLGNKFANSMSIQDLLTLEARAERQKAKEEKEARDSVWGRTQDIRVKEAEHEIALKKDALNTRTTEHALGKAGRSAALGLASVAAKLTLVATKAHDELVKRYGPDQDLGKLSLKSLGATVDLAARTVERAARAVKMAVEVERIMQGNPLEQLGVKAENLTAPQITAELRGMEKLLRRAAKLGRASAEDKAATAFADVVKDPATVN